jgi:hypothetical protein
MRGNYLNTGSRDAGADPNYDFKTGTYRRVDNWQPAPEAVAAALSEPSPSPPPSSR